jgi:hypothetical protein
LWTTCTGVVLGIDGSTFRSETCRVQCALTNDRARSRRVGWLRSREGGGG